MRTVFGGIAVSIPADQAKNLLKLPGVVAVQADEPNQMLTDSSPDFIGAPTVYKALGKEDGTAGDGAIVGVLDSGAWPEHPSFADPGIGAPPAKADGTPRTCNFGDNPLTPAPDVFVCNDKLISGEPFLDTYNAQNPGAEDYPDSARDSNGHGTHTATTSAGSPVANAVVLGVDRGAVHGIAPGAHVAVYKVCGADGCFPSDSVSAVEQAIRDGVDVINFSISGGTQPFTDPVELAFFDAYAAGVFVAASAGNDGPGASTANHLSPWVTTVAASTQQRAFESTLTVQGGGQTFTATGASITAGAPSSPLVWAGDAPYGKVRCDVPADPGTFTGKIVACERGGNARVDKGVNVLAGGAVGMVLYNPTLADIETDNHWLPTVHLADGTQFLAFLKAHPDATASFTAGVAATGQGDVMAAFSSRGPAGNWLKPDVTAPGVEILAGHTPTPESPLEGPPGQYFQAIAGTSMSSPHVAGSAALLASLHPKWTPGQIKSALMTTATTAVVKEDLETPADPLDLGSGRIDLTKAGDPGLTFDVVARDFLDAGMNQEADINLNTPSIYVPKLAGTITTTRTATNATDQRVRYRATATAPDNATITVTPKTFTLRPGESVKLTITVNGVKLPVDPAGTSPQDATWYFGQVNLDELTGNRDLHLPVGFTKAQGSVSLDTACAPTTITLRPLTESTCTVTATNTGTGDTEVDLKTAVSSKLRITGVTPPAVKDGTTGVKLENVVLGGNKPGKPAFGPAGDTSFGYLPLDAFGIAPRAVGDEAIVNYTVPTFIYAGQPHTRIGVTSNGYLVVDGGTSADVLCCPPQTLPNPVKPNNVLAPYWSDLDGTGTPGILVGTLTDGTDDWVVVEWRVHEFGQSQLKVFQTWIGLNGEEDITFNYDPKNLPGATVGEPLTVGAENSDGSGGQSTSTPPTEDLRITSSPAEQGESASYSLTVVGASQGVGQVTTTMISPVVPGQTVDVENITVNRK